MSGEHLAFQGALAESFFVNEYKFSCESLDEQIKYYFLDLGSLHSYVRKDPSLFLSSSFSRDFFSELRKILGEGSQIVTFGHGQYVLKAKREEVVINIGKFLQQFRFWSYFDDKEEHFSRVVDPCIHQITTTQVKNLFFENKMVKNEVEISRSLGGYEV